MKRLKFYVCWFNYYLGAFFTNHRKLKIMGEIYKKELEEAKENLK